MTPIVLALIWAAFTHFFQGASWLAVYDDCTSFLFWWYAILLGLGLFVGLIIPGVAALLGGGAATLAADSKFGKALAFLGAGGFVGATLGFMTIFKMAVKIALFVGGAYLMVHAADGARTIQDVDLEKALFGGAMILLGLWITRSRSSGSSGSFFSISITSGSDSDDIGSVRRRRRW